VIPKKEILPRRLPIASPSKIVCVGRNYAAHARELGNEVPAEPLLFFKPPSSLIGEGEPICIPEVSGQVEHEGEIGVVIGTRLHRVSPDEARRGVRGLVALNDVTARDLQKRDGQWARAKGFDTFCPVSAETPIGELDLGRIEVVTRVNGEERQRGSSDQMIFDIPALLAYISSVMTLEPGDLVATGTPAGVGRLSPGDTVEVELVGVARVRNPVMADSAGGTRRPHGV
jgi:2-keto-4-pentenoate hydratase/2-oxohepta-3-ene-1,7-dioic acid hydratase in catechol pathway